jgi:hypothetical protein
MKSEILLDAIGMISDNAVLDAKSNTRPATYRQIKWMAVAACLCVIIGVVTVFFSNDTVPPTCGESVVSHGFLVNGHYYYISDFAFYRYTPSTQEYERLTPNVNAVNGAWRVDGYGLYYLEDNVLFVREHESGETRRLYTANTVIWLRNLKDGQLYITLHDTNSQLDKLTPYICIDGKTGEIVWENAVTYDELNVLIENWKIPQKSPVELPYNGVYLAGIDDLLFFADKLGDSRRRLQNLYVHNIQTGETELLLTSEQEIFAAETDGIWLFTSIAPWSGPTFGGRTDCWKLVFDDTGKLIGLELWEEDIG